MGKWSRRFRSILVEYFALPSDVLLELPRVTIIGHLHLYIENHQGLLAYTDTELILKTKTGTVKIIGQSFVLKTMLPKELLLEGEIHQVNYIENNE